jgi:hypothetical protein
MFSRSLSRRIIFIKKGSGKQTQRGKKQNLPAPSPTLSVIDSIVTPPPANQQKHSHETLSSLRAARGGFRGRGHGAK